MNICWLSLYLIALTYSFAQAGGPQAIPEARIVRLTLDTQNVTLLHLRPGYVSCVRLPEDISTVVLGNPSTFKAEHSDAEPRLVSLKPTTPSPGETNALITTKTGREVALHLVSSGAADNTGPVDFILEYDLPRSFLIEPSGSRLIVSRTESVSLQPASNTAIEQVPIPRNVELLKQQSARKHHWLGKQLRVAVGPITVSRVAGRNLGVSDDVMKALVAYDWPGNVRELENCIERCCVMNSGPVIHTTDLPSSITGSGARSAVASPEARIMRIADLEKQAIVRAIEKLNGDKLMAAKLLGIGKTTLYRKLKEYGHPQV